MNLIQIIKKRIQENQRIPINEEEIMELRLQGIWLEEDFSSSLEESEKLIKEVNSWGCF